MGVCLYALESLKTRHPKIYLNYDFSLTSLSIGVTFDNKVMYFTLDKLWKKFPLLRLHKRLFTFCLLYEIKEGEHLEYVCECVRRSKEQERGSECKSPGSCVNS